LATFVAQLILLLSFGRLIGEGMSRLGQPAIFGQLIAGVLLGPSVFGLLLPDLHKLVFPETPALKSMIDAVSQIGILLLLLLTGMETNLALVNRRRRAVISTSLFGILVPFTGGVALAYALPDSVLPSPAARLVTALFLGTALSVSSVKIVGMVLLEVGALRRDLGQLILATAILDDTLAWIIIAVISGIALHDTVDLPHIALSISLTALFLAASLGIGRRLVAAAIVWANDRLTIEVPVITAILVIMLAMALTTELIGVHTALGAFVAGILIGQSPILTEHIEGELRGFIMAFFSPIFFAVAGLGMDLATLFDPTLLLFTMAVILVASVGKFLGALTGGRLGGMDWRESLTLAAGLNARGSTEVIVASIGLSMGALTQPLYTMVVAMAVITTIAMPPSLRWMLARAPLRDEEVQRLEREEAEQHESVPNMERALVYLDDSANGVVMAALAGLFAARRGVLTTVLETGEGTAAGQGAARLTAAARTARRGDPGPAIEKLVQVRRESRADRGAEHAVEKEAAKGYSIAFVGIEQPVSIDKPRFEAPVQHLVETLEGPVAILVNGEALGRSAMAPRNILVPRIRSSPPRSRLLLPAPAEAASRCSMSSTRARTRWCCAVGRGESACRCWSTPIGWASAAGCPSRA
jgi:Kef-type K+ transport system membrane component KefB